jgi:hypothetical protein
LKKRTHTLFRRLDRLISGPIRSQLVFFGCATLAIFLLIFILSVVLYPSETSLWGRFWMMVHNFMDVRGYDDTDGVAPFLVFIANIMGVVFFGGLLVSVLVNIFEQRVARVENGEVYYELKGHIVIIGYDPIVPGLVRQLLEQGREEVLLQTVRDVPEVRRLLFAELDEAVSKRVTLVSGNRTKAEDVEKLNVGDCSSVFLLGEGGEPDRDSQNIECLRLIAGQVPHTDKLLRCHVLFDRQATFAAFQQQDLTEIRERVDFVPFNFCEIWAKKVFVDRTYTGPDGEKIRYMPLDREKLTVDSKKHVHLVILGMSEMGVALGLQAAHICHFPNFFTKGARTRITFIDKNAKQEMDFLKGRMRNFFVECDWSYKDYDRKEEFDNAVAKQKFTDLEFEFIQARFEQAEVQDYLATLCQEEDTLLTIAATSSRQAAALAAGLYLPEAVYNSKTQILIRQELSYATVTMLSKRAEKPAYRKYRNIRPFGMFANAYDIAFADDLIPMMVKYTYDKANQGNSTDHFDRDTVEKAWQAPANVSANRSSNRYCAASIPVKMRSLGIRAGEPLTDTQIHYAALTEHNRWVTEKLIIGFRAPAPEEAADIAQDKNRPDDEKRRPYYKERFIHEDIKAYGELGVDEKDIHVKEYDIQIACAIPFMLRDYERITGRKAWVEE